MWKWWKFILHSVEIAEIYSHYILAKISWNQRTFLLKKFLDAGIQDVSTSISIVQDLIEMSPDDDESDKRI